MRFNKLNLNKKQLKKSLIIFLLFLFLSFIATYFLIKMSNPNIDSVDNLYVNKITFIGILTNNMLVCGFSLLGVFTFGITSFIVLVVNGISLGFIIGANYAYTNHLWYFIRIIIPHIIFELPAILISCSIGLEGISFLKKTTLKEKLIYVFLILILLIIAAFIEVNVSTLLV